MSDRNEQTLKRALSEYKVVCSAQPSYIDEDRPVQTPNIGLAPWIAGTSNSTSFILNVNEYIKDYLM